MCATKVTQILSIPSTFIENLHVLPNGELLLSTMDNEGLLYTLDPKDATPEPKQVVAPRSFGNTTGLSGIVPLGDDVYAVSGGLHTSFAFENDSMHVYMVDLRKGAVVDSIHVPGTTTMNGMAAVPRKPWKLLSGDSVGGRVLRIDTRTREVDVAIEDAAIGPADKNSSWGLPPIGINGLRTRGDYLYYTNSGLGTFGRVRIDEDGNKDGEFEILATTASDAGIYDDFTFDSQGNVYVALHSTAVAKISPDGTQTIFAGGGNSTQFKEPTSAALAGDGKSIYVSSGGTHFRTGNSADGGQVFQLQV